jgi:hypothetical protein
MATAFWVLVTAVLVLFVSKLEKITVVLNKRDRDEEPPESGGGQRRVEGDKKERGKIED